MLWAGLSFRGILLCVYVCLIICDLKIQKMRRSVSDLGCCATKKKKEKDSQLTDFLNLFLQRKSRFPTILKNLVWIFIDDRLSNSGIITVVF